MGDEVAIKVCAEVAVVVNSRDTEDTTAGMVVNGLLIHTLLVVTVDTMVVLVVVMEVDTVVTVLLLVLLLVEAGGEVATDSNLIRLNIESNLVICAIFYINKKQS